MAAIRRAPAGGFRRASSRGPAKRGAFDALSSALSRADGAGCGTQRRLSGAVERWNGGTVERWNGGTVERWNGGTVERWNGGTVERWNGRFGALRLAERLSAPEASFHRSTVPPFHRSTVPN